MNDLIRPALYQSYHEIVPVREAQDATTERWMWSGPVCESGDFFAQDRPLPEVKEGDLLALMSAGAYGFAMASNYNSRPLPAEASGAGRTFFPDPSAPDDRGPGPRRMPPLIASVPSCSCS